MAWLMIIQTSSAAYGLPHLMHGSTNLILLPMVGGTRGLSESVVGASCGSGSSELGLWLCDSGGLGGLGGVGGSRLNLRRSHVWLCTGLLSWTLTGDEGADCEPRILAMTS
jgi:hypothetical protein